MNTTKIIAFVGMSGSGKSVAVDFFTTKGIPKVYFGGLIYKEMELRGIPRTEDGESERKFREEIRATEGKDWVVNKAIEATHDLINAGQKRIVLDGVYSWTEYNILKKAFPSQITFIAIVLPKKLRYKRVANRSDRAFDLEAIRERDRSEIENLEKGGPIAAADYYVLNDGDFEKMKDQIRAILKEIAW